MKYQIAIDGPSGVGKSSVAFELAQRLNFLYVNTGLLFRGFAYICLQKQKADSTIKLNQIISQLEENNFLVYFQNEIFYKENNITHLLKDSLISEFTSILSQNINVRKFILKWEKQISKNNNVVMEGRDIGTIVLPNAFLKIFLTANSLTRAERRFNELLKMNLLKNQTIETINYQIQQRDERDQKRLLAPLKKADDAIEISTDSINCQAVVFLIEKAFLTKLATIENENCY